MFYFFAGSTNSLLTHFQKISGKNSKIFKSNFQSLNTTIQNVKSELAVLEGPDADIPSWIWERFQQLGNDNPDFKSSLEVVVNSLLSHLAPGRAGFAVCPQFRRRKRVVRLDWSMDAQLGDSDDSDSGISNFIPAFASTPSKKHHSPTDSTSSELPDGLHEDSVGNIVRSKGIEGAREHMVPDITVLKVSTSPNKRDEVLIVEELKIKDDPLPQLHQYLDNFSLHPDLIGLAFKVAEGEGVCVAIAVTTFNLGT
ncbi:hypothetical protein GYMLUDRAFT_248891 [Collybiopsis luxurians FD-317 M1]|uniref:Uncharacterized protein n=1 Tax=Collybiopsis luxurians FD-317 M1 TaxID=944289 RepID=A0A0D0CAP5_9AGAR|nr:hypothetical protein GYMLUDRAFT_248891 [Collybiopsis luxurians FD-317 M1]